MLLQRTSKNLSERVQNTFHQQGWRYRRWQARVSLVTLAVVLIWPAWAWFRNDRTMYQAGPVSRAHQLISQDCQQCHQQPWQAAVRLAKLDAEKISTPDEGCRTCHQGSNHHATMFASDLPLGKAPPANVEGSDKQKNHCADCHREHRGQEILMRVSDLFCTQCHTQLAPPDGPPATLAREFASFSAHPEFALLRPASQAPSHPRHLVYRVAELAANAQGQPQWQDKAKLRFNHATHLVDKLPIPPQPGQPPQEPVTLKCENCHQPDAQRRFMEPITFEASSAARRALLNAPQETAANRAWHCADCHRNELNFSIDGLAVQLPHREPENVRGVLREQLTRYIQHNRAKPPEPETFRRPFVPGPPEVVSAEDEKWIALKLGRAEDRLFHESEKVRGVSRGKGCALCHQTTKTDAGMSIVPPNLPDRWLGHGRFGHDSHRLLKCDECHAKVRTSKETSDILLPGIENCQKCHGNTARGHGASARADCVTCHQYHERHGESLEGLQTIQDVTGGLHLKTKNASPGTPSPPGEANQ